MQRWGQIPGDTQAERRAAGVFRPDLYARVLGEGSTTTAELLACDAVPFDGLSVTRYLQNFPIATPFESSAAGLNY
jgi:hypothetical protein